MIRRFGPVVIWLVIVIVLLINRGPRALIGLCDLIVFVRFVMVVIGWVRSLFRWVGIRI